MLPGQAQVMARKYRKRRRKGVKGGGRFRKGLKSGWTKSRRYKRRKILAMPKRRRRSRARAANPYRRRRSSYRRRNPMSLAGVKSTSKELISKSALTDYAYIGGGFLAGAILPRFVSKLVMKVPGLDRLPPMALELGIGALSAATAGIATSMITKSRQRAVQVAGGALVGALGALALGAVEKYLPMSGFGESAADAAVRRAVESEVKKELGVSGMGQFLTEGTVERDLSMQGMGDFVTASQVEEAGTVSGVFGAEADFDIEEALDY